MPLLKLRRHPANFSDEDVLIHPTDYPGLKLYDIVELKPPKGSTDSNRILLQVRKWPESTNYPNCVSIKDSIVSSHLKLYSDILVVIVDKKDVLVDSIEVCFSNAYLARSYMWGLRNFLNNRCVYQKQKLQYLHIRSQICEIWAHGKRVTSGYADDDTKIVFRSASSLVYLFIQMSSEMWDYDINGDLYCEKAINGFLSDLFDTWRRNDCSHDITIILFSRTYYDAETIEEFPEDMRECLQVDYKNRFYEDCYRVAFQNDRFDLHDWNAKLTTLKSLFNQYQKEVIDRHQDKYDTKIPRAYNSSASQGNFLEVLNMSINVFEKHYFDRSFDRTGQLSVVVSPGVGVFEVDFEMTNLTKQRIIDNGISSDLVCLGEQPLHTVPLLKFNSKSSQNGDSMTICDVYNMPHWINLSFYSSQNHVYYSNFVPRIKLPTIHNKQSTAIEENNLQSFTSDTSSSNYLEAVKQSTSCIKNHYDTTKAKLPELTFDRSDAKVDQLLDFLSGDNSNKRKSSSSEYAIKRSDTLIPSSHQTMPDLVDYDEYDAQVFKPDSMATYYSNQGNLNQTRQTLALSQVDQNSSNPIDMDDDFLSRKSRVKCSNSIQRRSYDNRSHRDYIESSNRPCLTENVPIAQPRISPNVQNTFTRMSLVDSYLTDVRMKPASVDDLSVRGYKVQSNRSSRTNIKPKALINPFDPSHTMIKLTPNRRRWTHVFPQGPAGYFIQQHHYQPVVQKGGSPYLADVSPQPMSEQDTFGLPKGSSLVNGLKISDDSLKTQNINHIANPNSDLSSYNLKTISSSQSSQSNRQNQILPASANQRVSSTSSSVLLPLSSTNHSKSGVVSNETVRFAWCASGEQEWTPAITTGVDWKSLTMPACLPLTTDFFPSKTSLQNDYVIGEYTIDSSCIHPRYTLIDVYRELVCQRLQKGFQIILLPRPSAPGDKSSHKSSTLHKASRHGSYHQKHSPGTSSQSAGHKLSSSHRNSHHSSSLTNSSCGTYDLDHVDKEQFEYTMSIGRIFHKLSLNGNTITVTQYRPRHPYPTIKIDYCYRFRAPFHETYVQSWVYFKNEKLENYSWNYLDNYICARGESFELRSSLKFWRFRILILPSRLNLRKIAHHKNPDTRHDLYHLEYSDEEWASLLDSFLKLLEVINTRRVSKCRTSTSSYCSTVSSCSSSANSVATTIATGSSQHGGQAHPAIATEGLTSAVNVMAASSVSPSPATQGQKLVEAACVATPASPSRLNVHISRMASVDGSSRAGTSASACVKVSEPLEGKAGMGKTGMNKSVNENDDCKTNTTIGINSRGGNSKDRLRFESINMDIDSALRDGKRAEWVHVQYHNFYDARQAFELVIKWMVASGACIAEMVQAWSRKAGNSSVHVVPIPWEPFALPHSGKADPLRCPLNIRLNLDCITRGRFLGDNQVISLQERILRRFGFVTFHDLISTENIERQFIHMSGFAFVALPNIVNELENSNNDNDCESSKANSSLICRLPSPSSSPIMLTSGNQGQDQHQLTVASGVRAHCQTKIGGLGESCGSSISGCSCASCQPLVGSSESASQTPGEPPKMLDSATGPQSIQSIKETGGSYRLACSSQTRRPIPKLKLEHQETMSSPHEEYITRHISGARQNTTSRVRGQNEQIEFIWSWNYMLTKRWRSPSTQDESYAVSLMQDFRAFCENSDSRLSEFWDEIKGDLV